MQRHLLLLCFLICCATANAEKTDSINFLCKVADAFTGDYIKDGEIDILSTDSTFICKGQWTYSDSNGKIEASLVAGKLPNNNKYILRLTHKDYVTTYYALSLRLPKRSGDFYYPTEKILMRKLPMRQKERTLGEAVVTATKIKMVMKGDTIVYNADAFQLSQGSMLDALIEQLPGAQLNEDGVITVNGKRISSLLVNGKDFFRGDPKIALENLPAYMVNKVKVYEQQTDYEKLTGRKEWERPLVMDVNLKKEYSVGWIANAEAAYGTENKYLGRVFGLRFTDCSRLAFFGNINNTNDTRRAGSKGDWTPSYLPNGLQTSRTAGGEYNYEDRQGNFKWNSNFNVSHTDNHTVTSTNSESFLSSGSAFSQSNDNSRSHSIDFKTAHTFSLLKGAAFHNGNVNFDYDKNKYQTSSMAGEFEQDPFSLVSAGALDSLFTPGTNALQQIARYRRSQMARSYGENWSISAPYSLMWVPFRSKGINDSFDFSIFAQYDKHSFNRFDNYDLRYFKTGETDYRNRYTNYPSRHYNYNAKLGYTFHIKEFEPGISYQYAQDYRSGRYDLFRLDRLPDWAEGTAHELGALPSSNTEMEQALDIQNSEHSQKWHRTHQVALDIRYQIPNKPMTRFLLSLPLRFELDHLLYNRSERHFDLNRTRPLFMPSASFQKSIPGKNKTYYFLSLDYNMSRQLPSLQYDIDLVNDANPLYVQYGNNGLHASTTHRLKLSSTGMDYQHYQTLYNVEFSYQRTRNAIATERTYMPETGGYKARPVNVNGNWSTDGSLWLTRQWGKKKNVAFSTNTSYNFNHSVDMANIDGATDNTLSVFKDLYLHEQLSLDYSKNGWNVGAKARVCYSHLAGNRADFNTINAWDYNYGITARIPIPGGIGLSTDFTIFSRRGYDDPSLNSDDVVWNMRLERSVLNGNLTFAVDGFDILHNLSKVTRTVNAQGRIESYSNVLPSYFMAHVIYKLNIQPKKKK